MAELAGVVAGGVVVADDFATVMGVTAGRAAVVGVVVGALLVAVVAGVVGGGVGGQRTGSNGLGHSDVCTDR